MASHCHNLAVLSSVLRIEDQKQVKRLGSVPVSVGNGKTMRISVLGSDRFPAAIGCSLPGVLLDPANGPCWTPEESLAINQATDHMLTVLRLAYDTDLDYLRLSHHGQFTFSYGDDEAEASYHFDVSFSGAPDMPDWSTLEAVFQYTQQQGLETSMDLLAESGAIRIPVHYRFLSAFKAVELAFPNDTAGFFDSLEAEIIERRVPTKQKARNAFPSLRARIAHALAKGAKEPGLTSDERSLVHDLLPILRRAFAGEIQAKHKNLSISIPHPDDNPPLRPAKPEAD